MHADATEPPSPAPRAHTPGPHRDDSGTSRRQVLRAVVALGALAPLLQACTGSGSISLPGTEETVSAEEQLANAALGASIARSVTLAASWTRLGEAEKTLTALAQDVAADHEEHRQALVTALGTSAAQTLASPTADAEATQAGPQAVRDRETAAALGALGLLGDLGAENAALLAQVAASCAVHADLLARKADLDVPGAPTAARIVERLRKDAGTSATGAASASTTTSAQATASTTVPTWLTATALTDVQTTPVTDATALDALQALLAGEHAAVYAYGVAVALAADSRQSLAASGLALHTGLRDTVRDLLSASGAAPVAAEPAYQVGDVAEAADVVDLAASVEEQLAVLQLGVVEASTQALRLWAAVLLVQTARRRASWAGGTTAWPGTAQ